MTTTRDPWTGWPAEMARKVQGLGQDPSHLAPTLDTDTALRRVQVRGEAYAAAKAALDARRAERDYAIRAARALDIPLRTIATAAGVSNPLVQQITAKGGDE